MIEVFDGVIEVSLRRLPLDKGKLRQAQSDTNHPLGRGCESSMCES